MSADQPDPPIDTVGRDGARFQGLARSIINGMIVGAGTGYVKTLQLVGTGYRAEVKGKILNLSLGFSHPVNFPIPEGIKVEIPGDSKGTLIILSGADKDPGAAPMTTARWLAANIETAAARAFMIALNSGTPLVKAGVLDAEATKAKLPACPLAASWRVAKE